MDFENIPSLKIPENKFSIEQREKELRKNEKYIIGDLDNYLSKTFIKNYFIPSKK